MVPGKQQTQVITISINAFHLILLIPLAAPTPRIDEVATWDVEIGKPKKLDKRIPAPLVKSEENP